MKIAITGTSGRIGHFLAKHFSSNKNQVFCLDRHALDLSAPDQIDATLAKYDFDVLVNPAAISSPDDCERDEKKAHLVNTEAPAAIAAHCAAREKYLIHFSTDYVFSGEQEGKRSEADPAQPLSIYGKTKLAGEQRVLAACPSALNLRVSWIYGAEKMAFVEQMRANLLDETTSPRAIADKFSIPTYMPDLAEWIAVLLEKKPSGTLHACHSGEPVSWHGIACEMLQILQPIKHQKIEMQRLAEISTFLAPRPVHTAMNNEKLQNLLEKPIADWKSILREYCE